MEWVRRDQKIRTGCTPRGGLRTPISETTTKTRRAGMVGVVVVVVGGRGGEEGKRGDATRDEEGTISKLR